MDAAGCPQAGPLLTGSVRVDVARPDFNSANLLPARGEAGFAANSSAPREPGPGPARDGGLIRSAASTPAPAQRRTAARLRAPETEPRRLPWGDLFLN